MTTSKPARRWGWAIATLALVWLAALTLLFAVRYGDLDRSWAYLAVPFAIVAPAAGLVVTMLRNRGEQAGDDA